MAGEGVEARIAALEARVGELTAENEKLRTENERLRELVARADAERGRNSENSSKPPSGDNVAVRKSRSERRAEQRAAGRRPGKQPGAPGSALCRREDPDEVRNHAPACCSGCGADLAGAEVVGEVRRQVFDVPRVEVRVTEHVAERRRCACGAETVGVFPPEATAPSCWGTEVRALAVYLLDRQHLPVARVAELLADVLGARVSTGWLCGLQLEAAARLGPFVEAVKDGLRASPVLHADETGTRVGATRRWVHTIATGLLTLLVVHPKRGVDAIVDMGVLPGYEGTVVHDGLASYESIDSASHAQCGAHLLRHLGACGEVDAAKGWTAMMTTALLAARAAAEVAFAAGMTAVPPEVAGPIRADYDRALDAAFACCPPGPPPRRRGRGGWLAWQRDTWNLAHRLDAKRDQVLRLLADTAVPFSNNQAERDLRMQKLHDKVSGTFRSEEGALAFVAVRSYLQTAAKHGLNRLDVLRQLFATGPWLPPAPSGP